MPEQWARRWGLRAGLAATLVALLLGVGLSWVNITSLLERGSVVRLAYVTLAAALAGLLLLSALLIRRLLGDRHVVEDALRARAGELEGAEQRIRELADAMPQIVWVADPAGQHLYLNEQWRRYTGFADAGPEAVARVTHPEDIERMVGTWHRAREAGETYQYEARLRGVDGQYRWFLVRAVPTRDASGAVVRWYGTSTDIDDQKRAEERLERLERLVGQRTAELSGRTLTLQAVLGAFPDLFFQLDAGGTILDYHAARKEDLYVPPESFLGRRIQDVLPPEVGQLFETAIAGVRSAGPVTSVEYVLNLPGGLRHFEARLMPLLEHEIIVIVRDITERKQAEEELRRAKEAAEAANRAKGEFLANMSHEIRTPMNGVLGMTELVLDTELTAEQREFLTAVRSSAQSLLGVINDILDFSKIEAGKLDLDEEPFSLRDVLSDTLKPLALRAQRKGVELIADVRPDLPDGLVGDAGRLRQVLVNLVGNAVKFTERGEIVVTVLRVPSEKPARTASDPEGASSSSNLPSAIRQLKFEVRDTGIGIEESLLETIFRPFEQADSSVTRRYEGTGLGLSIAARLVSLMGGELGAESQPGVGSTFWFTARLGVRPAGPREQTAPGAVSGLRALVVEDNPTARGQLMELLAGWGLHPHAATGRADGLAALGHARRSGEPFALLLLDATLPEGDAEALAGYARGLPAAERPAILLLTAGARREDLARWMEGGIAAHVPKPVRPSQLLAALQGAVAGTPVRPPPRAMRVLLVEDNPVNQQVAVLTLERHGHKVAVASSGQEALDALAREPFDVVLMDVQMPGMDGLEATTRLRERERGTGRHTPVIALTAHAMAGDRERCLAAGMDGYVSKPLQLERLDAELAGVLGPAGPALDAAELLARLGGNEAVLRNLVEVFQEDAPRRMDALRAAVARGDIGALAAPAHSLKGTLTYLSAGPGRDAAASLERAAREGDASKAVAAFEALQREVERVNAALARLAGGT